MFLYFFDKVAWIFLEKQDKASNIFMRNSVDLGKIRKGYIIAANSKHNLIVIILNIISIL